METGYRKGLLRQVTNEEPMASRERERFGRTRVSEDVPGKKDGEEGVRMGTATKVEGTGRGGNRVLEGA